jgi:hypothetical protein
MLKARQLPVKLPQPCWLKTLFAEAVLAVAIVAARLWGASALGARFDAAAIIGLHTPNGAYFPGTLAPLPTGLGAQAESLAGGDASSTVAGPEDASWLETGARGW